jgi:hypothetical protein
MLAIAGILPYVALKAAWLSGVPWGVRDDTIVSSATFRAANTVTFVVDLALPVVVGALLGKHRLMGPKFLLITTWLGIGLLCGALAAAGPSLIFVVATRDGPSGSEGLEPWIYALVYCGFGVQAIALVAAWSLSRFAMARAKPMGGLRSMAARPVGVMAGGVSLALLGCAIAGADAAGLSGTPLDRVHLGVDALVLAMAAWGLHRLTACPPGQWVARRVWWVVFAASGAAVTWGMYEAALAWVGLTGGWALAIIHSTSGYRR